MSNPYDDPHNNPFVPTLPGDPHDPYNEVGQPPKPYELIEFIDHIWDRERKEIVQKGTLLSRHKLGRMDVALYQLSRLLMPGNELAAIPHGFEHIPHCDLYLTDRAFGIGAVGEGAFGGEMVTNYPARFEFESGLIRVFAYSLWNNHPEIVKHTDYKYALLFPNSTINLLLYLR